MPTIGNNILAGAQKLYEKEAKVMGIEERTRDLLLREEKIREHETKLAQGDLREPPRIVPTGGVGLENRTHQNLQEPSLNNNRKNRNGHSDGAKDKSPETGGRRGRSVDYRGGNSDRKKVSEIVP